MTPTQLKQLSNDRVQAERILQRTFGHSHFYDEQWQAISRLLRGERILMIERTGFGKSLCYQFPACLLDGVTVVFSPLIALMRDQVQSLSHRGINARCINSEQTPEQNSQSIEEALEGKLKILYIAPERQENEQWVEATRRMPLSMIVVDEAHTVSVWGHDFRPAFRRIANLVRLLPHDMPILATTATATVRVQRDIVAQLGDGISVIRGNLMRSNFNLRVISVNSDEEKMSWLAHHVNDLPGFGLIYAGTRVETETYARWLKFCQVNVMGYHAGLDADTRKQIELGMLQNRWKCIVTTNALGMGIDKGDIHFIIHLQLPASPIHYYQEIGRAGRDGKPTDIVLLYNGTPTADGVAADTVLPRAFIDGAKPSIDKYNRVIDVLKADLLGEQELIKATNLKQTQVRVIKADLMQQGIIREVVINRRKKYEYQYNAPALDPTEFENLRQAKLSELAAMVEYVHTRQPRMQYLCEYLGDQHTGGYSPCDNTTLQPWHAVLDDQMLARIDQFRQTYFPKLELQERKSNIACGVAASYYGVSSVAGMLHRSKYEHGGDFPDFLVTLTLRAFYKTYRDCSIDCVMFIPPTVSGQLVEHFAARIASALRLPLSHALVKTRQTDAQKVFQNGYSKRDNVKDAFALSGQDVTGQTILLIDDICDSGATLREAGRMLTAQGAKAILPLVIAKTVGNDANN